MDELNLVSSESSKVGDIEDTIVGLGVLSVDTSDLDEVLGGNGFEKILSVHEFWEVDVDGSSKSSSEVSWASGDVTEMLVVGEFGFIFNEVSSLGESGEDLSDIGSLLHRDDSELILFVNPDEESFGIVMVDTSSLWPVSFKSSRFKIFVATFKEEMVSNKLFFSLSQSFYRGNSIYL